MIARLLRRNGWSSTEAADLARLMRLCAELPPPPDPLGCYPHAVELRERLRGRLARVVSPASATRAEEEAVAEQLEEAFLEFYAHLHGYEAPYTREERRRVDKSGGYWCHAGGVSPILRARPWVGADTCLVDLGAGNGLQGLLVQALFPHRLSVQVEISSRMIEAGKVLCEWLGVEAERVRWVERDLCTLSVEELTALGSDFVYLYRPLRPEGPGRVFYERLATALAATAAAGREAVVFSIADPLRPFLRGSWRELYGDGHLTCYAVGGEAPVRRRKSDSRVGAP